MYQTSTPTPPRVLVADDQADILQALRLLLVDAGLDAELVNSVDGIRDRIGTSSFDLLLMDLNYTRDTTSGKEGLDVITEVRARDRHLPIVVMTGWGSIDTAVEAMRRGARSFVQKPWDDVTLVEVVKREIEEGAASRRTDARLEREQEEARLIQRTLLPSSLPALKGIRIAAMWNPASGFGGDCYDVIQFAGPAAGMAGSAERVGVMVADVAGKGLPAALLMSNLQAAVRAYASEDATPQQVAASVNRLLCRNIAVGKFVSFCYMVVDRAQGTLTFANAGHNPPLLVRAGAGGQARNPERLLSGGMVLGVMPDAAYDQHEVAIAPGDRLILYTDGIIEAEDASGVDYGETRLGRAAAAHGTLGPQPLLDALFADVSQFARGQFTDDATLIVVAID